MLGAAWVATSMTRRHATELPTILSLRERLDSRPSAIDSPREGDPLRGLRTLFTMVRRFSGFSTKSYAPSRIGAHRPPPRAVRVIRRKDSLGLLADRAKQLEAVVPASSVVRTT